MPAMGSMLAAVPPERRDACRSFAAVALVSAAVFAVCAVVVAFEITDGIDHALQRRIASVAHDLVAHGAWMRSASVFVARLGSVPVTVGVAAVSATTFLVVRRSLVPGILLAVTFFCVAATVGGLKDLYNRPEPYNHAGRLGFSFPSGHAAVGIAVWGGTALLLVVLGLGLSGRGERWLAAACVTVAAGVPLAMTLRSAHWLTDVVAGVALGVGWLCLWMAVFVGFGWLSIRDTAADEILLRTGTTRPRIKR